MRDIDFYVGLICEKIPDDMVIPNTAAHIISEQFQRLKIGDRFFIEHDKTLSDGKYIYFSFFNSLKILKKLHFQYLESYFFNFFFLKCILLYILSYAIFFYFLNIRFIDISVNFKRKFHSFLLLS